MSEPFVAFVHSEPDWYAILKGDGKPPADASTPLYQGELGTLDTAIAMPTAAQRAQVHRDVIEQARMRGASDLHARNRAAGLNGCHNREPFKQELVVQDGWMDCPDDGHGNPSRVPRWKRIPFRMSADCRYSLDPMGPGQRDPKCTGCRWKQSP